MQKNFFILFYSFAFGFVEIIYKKRFLPTGRNRLLYQNQLSRIHSKYGINGNGKNQQGQSNNAQQANQGYDKNGHHNHGAHNNDDIAKGAGRRSLCTGRSKTMIAVSSTEHHGPFSFRVSFKWMMVLF
ncbi:MAG: hypothetical protein KIG21_05030 [Angelakisella sp.]|nr:hypothetical protein [Angelakisella sp.]